MEVVFPSKLPVAQVTLKPLVVGHLESLQLVVGVEHITAHATRERDVEAHVSVDLFMSALMYRLSSSTP